MKLPQITARPGFELVFALSIAAIFIIPSMVMAQSQKNTEIMITNGDTVINGKNIKTLSPQERTQALNDMAKLKPLSGQRRMIIKRDMKAMPGQPPMIANDGMAHQYGDYIGGDHVERPMHLKKMNADTSTRTMVFSFRSDDGKTPPPPPVMMNDRRPRVEYFRRDGTGGNGMPRGRGMMFNNRNSQRFSYSNTDANGASTNVNYSVTEPMAEDAKGDEKSLLSISNIKLVPDFTSGKTMLSFDLPAKALTTVELLNSEEKVIWSEKANVATFTKSFALPLNGMYSLKVKQGSKSVTKNIMKEE